MGTRIVVIGASAAGLRAASRAKRLLPDADVRVFDREAVISVGACGLPYYLSGDVENADKLRATAWGQLRDPEFFHSVKDVTVRTGVEAVAIDRAAKTVRVRDSAGAEEAVPYDRLVLATGATPKRLPGIPIDHPRVTVFKTIDDAKRWRARLEAREVDRVAVLGAGYIGCELAEAFGGMWGCEVDLIEAEDRVLPQVLDPEMAALVQAHLEDQGIRVHLNARVEGIDDADGGLAVRTSAGVVATQHAVLALGFAPAATLAADAGLAIAPTGGIAVDASLRTSDPDVFAAGDCIEVTHAVSGRLANIPLGSLANKQGRVVGDVLAGRDARFGPVVGSGAVKVFDLNVAATGLTEASAARAGIESAAVWGTFSDKAHYHPGDKTIQLKLVFAPTSGRLLGLQAVGAGDVVRRVDVFAALLARGGTVGDLLDLEFAYAPPYAPPLDPLYVLGCAAINQVRDGVRSVAPSFPSADVLVLDARTRGEAKARPLPGSLNIPLDELRARLSELAVGRNVLVVCAKGPRSAEAARILLNAGREGVTYLGGGLLMRVTEA
jgi:NADPH-dependent 2,4-dienoyl-CoA reductase/sulfur reductase-like enzyme/rhodanese-related sulfurtransferase